MQNKRKKEECMRPVACGDETVSIETLPYPAVYYPAHYGAFLAFKPDTGCSHYTFCECSRNALNNYVRLLKASPVKEQKSCQHTRKLVDKGEFPISFVRQDNSGNLDEFLGSLVFRPRLCHVCNRMVPSYAYCVKMYGSRFKQSYGWYMRQDTFKRGVYYSTAAGASRFIAADGEVVFFDTSNPPDFLPSISDDVRTRLRAGDNWKSEAALYKIIASIYPGLTVVRHYRAPWLENLELDIFIQEIRTGVEYQGIQHYKPLKHWGGEKGFERRRMNDARKSALCMEHGVRLIYFTYQEDITPESVLGRISGP